MRALVIDQPGPVENLELRELPDPVPGAGEVRIKVAYTAVKPLDSFARRGDLDWMPVPWPYTPGSETSGVIDQVGEGVTEDLLGHSVFSGGRFGGMADYLIADAKSVVELGSVDLKTGAVFHGPINTSYQFMSTVAHVRSGETVLIHSAAGALGIVLTQMCKEKGAHVIGLLGGMGKAEFARAYGADQFIDYTQADWPEQVKAATNGVGANLIIDGNAGDNFPKNYAAVAWNGRIFLIGYTAGPYPESIPFSELFNLGISVGSFAALSPSPEDRKVVLEAAASGRWKVPITAEASLEDAVALIRRFEDRQIMGRAVINVGA